VAHYISGTFPLLRQILLGLPLLLGPSDGSMGKYLLYIACGLTKNMTELSETKKLRKKFQWSFLVRISEQMGKFVLPR
jgi:hypothetical protein